MNQDYKTIEELKGRTITLIEHTSSKVIITCSDKTRWQMFHEQDCCETVDLDKIEGDPAALYGEPIVVAKEQPGHGEPGNVSDYGSVTLTDFTLETAKASVTFHWIGSSNGYYSEEVYFCQLTK